MKKGSGATQSDSAKFNGDGRFLISTGFSGVATYDVERSQIYKFADINNGATGVSWFDN